jgi:hypothetical protein
VKRRIFREALRMRMRAMAQLADTWRDTAERAIDILDSLDADNNPNGSMSECIDRHAYGLGNKRQSVGLV